MGTNVQLGLFGAEPLAIDSSFGGLLRTELGNGAWIEHVQGFVLGHERLLDELVHTVRWRREERVMYEQTVQVPRLYAVLPQDGPVPEVLERARRVLDQRYSERFERLSLGYYRDGQDSVAWHGDYVARRLPSATVATISVGTPRAFHLRPKGGGQRTTLELGWGDLLVMGGSCQRTFEHSVPKVKQTSARIAIMFRPVWQE
jgi:alkylated DNA repair dioxygenase AlkB